jgi:hypothetical protein
MKTTVKAINRLKTCIVVFAPSTRKIGLSVLPNHAPQLGFSRHPPWKAALGRGGGTGRNPGFSNHNSGPVAMHLIIPAMRQSRRFWPPAAALDTGP